MSAVYNFFLSFFMSLATIGVLVKLDKIRTKGLIGLAIAFMVFTIVTIADVEISVIGFGAAFATFLLLLMVAKLPKITPPMLFLALIIGLIAISTPISALEDTINADVLVYYKNNDGFTILAKDGQQVTGDLNLVIYVDKPSMVHVTATVGTEKIIDEKQAVDFKLEYPITVPESKYNYILTINVEITSGVYTKTITRSFTVVKKPIPPKLDIGALLTPSQVRELINEAKWTTIIYAVLFAVLGIVAAVIMKYKMMILDVLNIYQILFLGAAATAAIAIDPSYGIGYFMIFAVADVLSYRYLEGPERIEVLEFDAKKRIVWQYSLPLYVTKAGRLAVALQDFKNAFRRFLGEHVYLDVDNSEELNYWRLNNEYSLILAEKADIKEKTVTKEEAAEDENTSTLFAIRRKVKDKERVFYVKPFDAHKLEFLRDFRTLDRVLKDARDAWNRVKELEKTLELERVKSQANALRELIGLLNPKYEENSG